MAVETHKNILDGCEIGEETNILIGARNSKTDDSVGQQTNEKVVVKKDLSSFRTVKTGDAIEEGRLASPIGSDDAVDAMFFYLTSKSPTAINPPKRFVTFRVERIAIKSFYLPR